MNLLAFIIVFVIPLMKVFTLDKENQLLDKFDMDIRLKLKGFRAKEEKGDRDKQAFQLVFIASLLFVFFYGMLGCQLFVGKRYSGTFISFTFKEALGWALTIDAVACVGYYLLRRC